MKQSKFKVLYLTNIPSPYMVGYLEEFVKYVDLNVVFEKGFDSHRPDNWKNSLLNTTFKYKILSGIDVSEKIYGDSDGSAPNDKAFSFSVLKYISKDYDFIIVANPCTPTGILEILYLNFMRIPFSIQSEGGIPGNGKGCKEHLKYFLMHKAKYYFSTCDLDDRYFFQYGAKPEEIRRYPFASISEKELPSEVAPQSLKKQLKEELGIKSKWFVLTVGRSVPVKGFDILLKAIPQIKEKDLTIGFVGGKCIEEYQKIIRQEDCINCFFQDQIEFQELSRYYKAADIFVLPTRSDTWGLVINEAMTYGLPVITTDMCVAGNALIKNGKNGYIVPKENASEIAEKIDYLIENPELIEGMSENNFLAMRKWTFEEMGKTMHKHLVEIMG